MQSADRHFQAEPGQQKRHDCVTNSLSSISSHFSFVLFKSQAKQLAIGAYKQSLANSNGMVGTMAPKLLLAGKFEPSEFAAKVGDE